MNVVSLLWFSRRDYHSTISGHVSKVFSLVSFHFSAQSFKHVVASFLCFNKRYWITILCITLKFVYVPPIISAIYNFMSKIISCIT
jgi:hypothetical protein